MWSVGGLRSLRLCAGLPRLGVRPGTGEVGGYAESPMNFDSLIAREVDAGIWAWRTRVLNVLLVFSSVTLLLPVAVVVSGLGVELPKLLRAVVLALYLPLLLVALRPRWDPRMRAYLLLLLIGLAGAIRLAVGRLEGSGRITLLLLPLLALLLAGPRAGWTAVGVTTGLYAAVPLLLKSGGLSGLGAAWTAPGLPLAYWGTQGLFWLIVLATLMILFTRFQSLQRDTMIAERRARLWLETETADRRRLEAEMGRIGEEERRQLGAALHDGLCQHLTASLLDCSVLEARHKAAGGGEALALERLRKALADALGMAYDAAKGLCPLDIAPDALIPALERLCLEAGERDAVDCRLRSDPGVAIRDAELALHLYRIAREAVANAAKHARGACVKIALEQHAGEWMLRGADDGPLSAPGGSPPAGMGLSIVADRAQKMGGTLKVAGLAPHGLEVVCRVPMQKE